jgi:prepilin signal peptidase PulO-like enzyme (type II secretory pathway)
MVPKHSQVPIAIAAAAIFCIWAALELRGIPLVLALLLAVQLSLLLAFDVERMVLPNTLNATLAVTGLAATWWLDDGEILERIAAMAVGSLSLAFLAWIYRRYRNQDGLGMGDAKLFGALGTWVGLAGLPSILLLAALGGLVFGFCRLLVQGRESLQWRLPFGPFLCVSGWIVWLYGPLMLH